MHWSIQQLIIPLKFFAINHGEKKHRKMIYDFLAPACASIVVTFIQLKFSSASLVVAEKGIFDSLSTLLGLFAAFFIAALAAVATFQNGNIDKEMKTNDGSKTFFSKNNKFGEPDRQNLTRRQYLCYLFGYLSLATILFVLSVSAFAICKDAVLLNQGPFLYSLNAVLVFIFWFFLVQIILLTLLGLGFLTEKVNDSQ